MEDVDEIGLTKILDDATTWLKSEYDRRDKEIEESKREVELAQQQLYYASNAKDFVVRALQQIGLITSHLKNED